MFIFDPGHGIPEILDARSQALWRLGLDIILILLSPGIPTGDLPIWQSKGGRNQSLQGQGGDDNPSSRIDPDSDHVRNVGNDGFDAGNLEFRQLRGRIILRRDALEWRTHKEDGKKCGAEVQSMRAHCKHILALILYSKQKPEIVPWSQYRYHPPVQGGHPVKVSTEVEVRFDPRKCNGV